MAAGGAGAAAGAAAPVSAVMEAFDVVAPGNAAAAAAPSPALPPWLPKPLVRDVTPGGAVTGAWGARAASGAAVVGCRRASPKPPVPPDRPRAVALPACGTASPSLEPGAGNGSSGWLVGLAASISSATTGAAGAAVCTSLSLPGAGRPFDGTAPFFGEVATSPLMVTVPLKAAAGAGDAGGAGAGDLVWEASFPVS